MSTTESKTFTLKSNELGGQLTNRHYLNGMGLSQYGLPVKMPPTRLKLSIQLC